MKNLRYLEIAAAVSLMLSKYFLAVSNILGWWLSIIGYILTAIYNVKVKLRIVSIIVMALALLSVYGLYKWTHEIAGLQTPDFIIISLSIIFALILIIKEARQKKPLWLIQSITTILFGAAFILLGFKMELGWYVLILGHANNTYLYYKKDAFIIATTQIASIFIALFKIIG